ncbi:hypothetical protein [Paraglaciecola polaris]|uniref:hypothetical protein n=1 Tax=Paraglaciecola polaris TaxID=222814 RepID=UPI000691DAF1|nr:hypothetical protein [Paraglaciecola polaris]|tara:strand:- start:296 stop:574 length:279 start_codon:yes stop_codon:yes gene_type:complete
MFKKPLAKLAADPQKSWGRFKYGLGFFVIGAALVLLGSKSLVWLQVPGLIALAIGCIFALYGYIGILAYRMKSAFTLTNADRDKDKQNTHQD